MKIFPHMEATIQSTYSLDHIKSKLENLSCDVLGYNYIIVNSITSNMDMMLLPKSDNFMSFNSFIPIVYLNFKGEKDAITIIIAAELIKSVKVLFCVYSFFCVFFQVVFTIFLFWGKLSNVYILFLPFFLFLFVYIMVVVGFKISASKVMEHISQALNC